jgi:hypothetical protein
VARPMWSMRTFPGFAMDSVVWSAVKLVGQPPTCGQSGETHCVFPGLSMGTALARSGGIGAADCPQIHSTRLAWRQAASAVTVVDWPR